MSETKPISLYPEPLLYLSSVAISADRALGHFLPELSVSPSHMGIFYSSLPHQHKPPLSDLSIHFTASSLTNGEGDNATITYGKLFWDGTSTDTLKATSELPKTKNPTIVIYLGSELLHEDDPVRLSEDLNEFVTHELTHYAQGRKDESRPSRIRKLKSKAELLGMTALYGVITDRRWARAGTATLIASEILTSSSVMSSAKVAAAAAAIVHVSGRKNRSKHLAEKDHTRYLKRDHEADARAHEDSESGIVTLEVTDFDRTLLETMTLHNQKGMRASRFVARRLHKELTLKSSKDLKHKPRS